jgi:hypothetical protein
LIDPLLWTPILIGGVAFGVFCGYTIGHQRARILGQADVQATVRWWLHHFDAMRRVAEGLANRDLGLAQAERLVAREFKAELAIVEDQWTGVPAAIAEANGRIISPAPDPDRARDG